MLRKLPHPNDRWPFCLNFIFSAIYIYFLSIVSSGKSKKKRKRELILEFESRRVISIKLLFIIIVTVKNCFHNFLHDSVLRNRLESVMKLFPSIFQCQPNGSNEFRIAIPSIEQSNKWIFREKKVEKNKNGKKRIAYLLFELKANTVMHNI